MILNLILKNNYKYHFEPTGDLYIFWRMKASFIYHVKKK